jgi:hypothetical protein
MAKLKKQKQTKKKAKSFRDKVTLLNVARSLIVLYSLFLAIFALDTPFGIGLLVHLLPTIIILGTLVLTLKNHFIAGSLFILEGLGTIFIFHTYRDLFVFFIISAIPLLIGIMFLIASKKD